MNLFVADPHWGWWIIFYFFLGGIAAGAYFMATLIDLVGRGAHRELSRIGYGIAFPLVLLCGVVLIVDLDRPDRFWHMLFKSEVVAEAFEQGKPGLVFGSLMFKYWSPMSVGSWALLLFGLCSSFSLLGSLWPDGRLSRLLGRGVSGRGLQLTGCLVGFFVASYTGALVTATNQPLWSDSVLIAPLFLTSAASTGIALMILLAQGRTTPAESLHRLERADTWALGFELFVFAAFLVSLGSLLGPVWSTRHGKLLLAGVPVVGLLMPLAIRASHVLFGRESPGRLGALSAAALALVGGFVLRYALLTTPPELLADRARQPTVSGAPEAGTPAGLGPFGPEDGRERGGGPGADPENRRDGQRPPSKVFQQPGADAP
jgi:formate-dependent nitrite reductase membrane component NrfD